MAAENQEVNMSYGFALRGDRQVERGLDSIMERFIRTGSIAEASALAVEKFGRVFEVGLPVALGAAALGMAIEGLYNVGEEAIKTQEKIAKLTSIPISDLDISGLDENLSQIGDEMEAIGTDHGKKYGQSFVEAVGEGIQKLSYNSIAFAFNNTPDLFKNLPTSQWLLNAVGIGGTNSLPSYDQSVGNTSSLSNRARGDMAAIDAKNAQGINRLSRNEMVSLVESQEDKPNSYQSKNLIAHMKLTNAQRNVHEDDAAYNTAADSYTKYQTSIAGGGDLTQDEIKEGVRLQKLLNETHRQLIEDTIAQDQASREASNITKEMNGFHKGDVVASRGHKIGGGGGIYSPNAPAMPSATNELKSFSDSVRKGTEALDSVFGNALSSFSTPTF